MKEEAKELIESFYPFVEGIDRGERHRAACQCALICVDKIINVLRKKRHLTDCVIDQEFYQGVRKIIEQS